MKVFKVSYLQYAAYVLIILLTFGYLLIIGKFILAPLLVAIFFSIALLPILKYIRKHIKSDLWSVIVLMILNTAVIGGISIVVYKQIQHFSQDFDKLEVKLKMSWVHMKTALADSFGLEMHQFEELAKKGLGEMINSGSETAVFMFENVTSFFSYILLVPIYTFLILLYRKRISAKVNIVLSGFHLRYRQLAEEFADLIQNYLKGMLIVMILVGLMNSIGLYFLGVSYAFALGFMVALFTIIPYIGITLGGIFVLAVSYATQGSLTILFLIVALLALVQFIEGNFLTPSIVGNKLNVNTLTAIIALLIGGQIWGIPGMIMAIPSVAAITLLFNQFKEEVFYERQ